ncbi:MAG TPA: hypothetical protein DCQ97_02215 [Chitinophagaceae bacterium]|nr:hypothetical protein [Chitinophagaceae bacterium]
MMKTFLIAGGICSLLGISSCSKRDKLNPPLPSPTVTAPNISSTADATSITSTSAVSGGTIANDGGGTITARGVCWSTSVNPTITHFKTSDGTGPGTFTSTLTGLSPATGYYIRAYATNSVATSYGPQVVFRTP